MKALLLTAILTLPAHAKPAPHTLTGRVVSVTDGDTICVLVGRREVRVRLNGIDAPERKQPWSMSAQTDLSRQIFGRVVRVRVTDIDRYGRSIGDVYLGQTYLNRWMVERGLAWAYRRYSVQFVPQEMAARKARRGLWADPWPVAPWEWRKRPHMRGEGE